MALKVLLPWGFQFQGRLGHGGKIDLGSTGDFPVSADVGEKNEELGR